MFSDCWNEQAKSFYIYFHMYIYTLEILAVVTFSTDLWSRCYNLSLLVEMFCKRPQVAVNTVSPIEYPPKWKMTSGKVYIQKEIYQIRYAIWI